MNIKHLVLALFFGSTALMANAATCVFEQQSVPSAKESIVSSVTPIVSEGRVTGVSINGRTFTIARDTEGRILGATDSSGKLASLSAIAPPASSDSPKKAGGDKSTNWSGDPCNTVGGGSIEFDIFNYEANRLERVEIVGEAVKRVDSWFPVLQKPFPSDQELISQYGPRDQIQECRGRLYACLDGIAGIDSSNLGTCVAAAAIAADKGLWPAAIVFAACLAGKDYVKEQKTNACWAAYATCSLQTP